MKIRSFLVIIIISFTLTALVSYAKEEQKIIKIEFEPEVINEINKLFSDTHDNVEFLGNLEVKNGIINNFNLLGYKNLDDNHISLLNESSLNDYTIHSHPQGLCLPSFQDQLFLTEKICLVCGVNKIVCYQN